MEEYKAQFIQFLLQTGALKVFENPDEDRTLKSKRISPWFVNMGDFNDGDSSQILSELYADAIFGSGVEADVLYGIPDKGVGLVAPVAIAMARKGRNMSWCFSRKDEKKHGEASHLGPEERIKALLVGRIPQTDNAIIQLDDVFTAGDAKYDAHNFLVGLGRTNLPLLAIGVDRQEVNVRGQNAIRIYEDATRTRVVSIVNAMEIISYLMDAKRQLPKLKALKQQLQDKRATIDEAVMDASELDKAIERFSLVESALSSRAIERLALYMRVYGTEEARAALGIAPEQLIIGRDRSVIPACDVPTLEHFEKLVKSTCDVEGIGGYKIGFELGLRYGLRTVVETARKYTDKPIIYDHQKAGTDIPDTGRNFARVMKEASVDAVIMFPQAGPETERAWIYHALDHGLKVIIGGRMTHPAYAGSEGGFITDEGALEMYRIGARAGINHFVVPGNKPDVILQVKEAVEAEGVSPVFYAPGFVAQGGKIGEAARVAGDRFHGIVGRGIYQAKDMKQAAIEHTSQL